VRVAVSREADKLQQFVESLLKSTPLHAIMAFCFVLPQSRENKLLYAPSVGIVSRHSSQFVKAKVEKYRAKESGPVLFITVSFLVLTPMLVML